MILDWQAINQAADIMRAGGLVAMPTETVYGLAADATNDRAVARVFEAKGRPRFNPLIIHVDSLAAAERHAEFFPLARRLAAEFWPGPLTLVLPRKADSPISWLATAGLATVALRAPAHDIAQALLKSAGRPLAAPSANPSGSLSPTRAQHVRDGLGDAVDMILDGGPSPVGVESTVVKVDGDALILLRPGGLAVADIERAAGRRLRPVARGAGVEAPGMLVSHYAPQAPLRINAQAPRADEAFLAFGATPDHPHTLNLSVGGDLREAAANLFSHLRALDRQCAESGLAGIAAAPVPADGLGEAINDRLMRAAAHGRQ
jgi:L-threonylcarbamoyladenylate synthase